MSIHVLASAYIAFAIVLSRLMKENAALKEQVKKFSSRFKGRKYVGIKKVRAAGAISRIARNATNESAGN